MARTNVINDTYIPIFDQRLLGLPVCLYPRGKFTLLAPEPHHCPAIPYVFRKVYHRLYIRTTSILSFSVFVGFGALFAELHEPKDGIATATLGPNFFYHST